MPHALPIKGLHHISRVTRKPEESAAFYRDVLGFSVLPRPNFNFRGAWLYGYGVQIHIIENTQKAPQPGDAIDTRADHLAFSVSDLAPVRELLAEHKIAVRENVNAGGVQQIFFQDPDGHHIEIAVYGDPSQPVVT